jgi:hypothetical protein
MTKIKIRRLSGSMAIPLMIWVEGTVMVAGSVLSKEFGQFIAVITYLILMAIFIYMTIEEDEYEVEAKKIK